MTLKLKYYQTVYENDYLQKVFRGNAEIGFYID